jgi:hypothetical protein
MGRCLFGAWNTKYELLLDFIKENGKLPTQHAIYKDIRLGIWINSQRQGYVKGQLTADHIAKLESIKEWIWVAVKYDTWMEKYEKVLAFETQNQHPPRGHSYNAEEAQLARWASTQCRKLKGNKLSDEKKLILKTLPFSVSVRDAKWKTTYDALRAYIDKFHVLPRGSETYNGAAVAVFIHYQRDAKKRGTMRPEREKLLNALPGWRW